MVGGRRDRVIRLEAHELQWILRSDDEPADQCAHGRVLFEVDGITFVKPEDGLWTLSAAGLYLLRSLREDHSASNPVSEGNFLFPCCGFFVVNIGVRFPVFCFGCLHGMDLEIGHSGDSVNISSDAGSVSLPSEAWRRSVTAFTSSVRDFYRVSAPKESISDQQEREGWAAFWQEWDERSAEAGSRRS
jgi:hypothetical protein